MSATRPFDALVFDLDGTLIDSMPLHERAWARWFADTGRADVADADFFAATAGRTAADIVAELFPAATPAEVEVLADAREARYRELARAELRAIDGAIELLQAARGRGLKLAIGTAAPPANIAVAFERFGLAALVDTVASPADGLRGKPHPDLFTAAAQRLGTGPARSLVFEDAPLGLEAARRAGMPAVALTTTLSADALGHHPHVIATVKDFTELDHALLFA